MLTHTSPRPPPGAGVAVPVLPVRGAAEGDAPIEVLGLNKSPSLNFGEAVGLAAGLAVASVCAFLREPLALGDASGDSAIGSEAALSAGDAVA